MNKHAYLIMAHGNWGILEKLIELLDDEKNDIYLHIDAKVKAIPINLQEIVKHSNIFVIDAVNVYWADYSQVRAVLNLLKAAKNEAGYSYYHLLSGADLPIKSNGERFDFFEKSGKEFIGIVPNEVYYSLRRVKFYHPFLHNSYYRNSKIFKGLDRIFEYIQKILGVNRLKCSDWKIMDGWQWFSITSCLCEYVLQNENLIEKMFFNTLCPDELFLQTLVYNSEFYKKLYDISDLKNGSMRFIDWNRGKPYTWGAEAGDFEQLMQSPYMFARKFDEKHKDIVDRVFEEINRRNKNDK